MITPKCRPYITYAYVALFFASILALVSVYISPYHLAIAGFLSLLVPVAIILNVIALVFFAIKGSLSFLFPLYILLLGHEHVLATFALNLKENKQESGQAIRVLSYNTQFFQVNGNEEENTEIKDWIMGNDADIMCFQEFSNDATSDNLNIIQTLSENGRYDFIFSTVRKKIDRRQAGVVIFSKLPIVKKGELLFSQNRYNKGCFADIKIANDTIRIINVHLHSMQLNEKGKSKNVLISSLRKLKNGLIKRSIQSYQLLQFIDQSPHKVIICGDLNSTPYSYVYNVFKRRLKNAFEMAGNGFGVSYPGKFLFFLRIDHQFYDSRIKILDFKTLNSVSFSDHYPITGIYQL